MVWAVDAGAGCSHHQPAATMHANNKPLPACLPAHHFRFSRDGYAVAIFYPDTATLSVDLLAASEAAILRMGTAGGQLCEQLVAEWPGSRISAKTVSRLKKMD